MALAAETGEGALATRVEQIIRNSGHPEELAIQFARIFMANADEADLEGITPEGLAALITRGWEFIVERMHGECRLRVINHDDIDAEPGPFTVIEILNNDMPFLVDSVMGEILERSHVVHMVSHPILHVKRSESGRVEGLAEANEDDRDTRKESYIHVHIARLEEEAERQELEETLSEILDDVGTVVRDWRSMIERINHAVSVYTNAPPPVPVADLAESIQFLKWLLANNFTFLGLRQLNFEGGAEQGELVPVDDSGLGILRDENVRVLRRGTSMVHMTPEIRKFFLAPAPLIVAKANVRSRVHRRAYMDYIGIKTFTEDGEIAGELRVVGLFTSAAYTSSVRKIPFLRHKTDLVVRRSGYPEDGHSGKALLNVLETFPRDELFQIDARNLYDVAMGIQKLELHPRARAFSRIDEFDRFVSIIVYVPRDRYSTEVRARICNFLAETYHGRVSAYYPFFPEGPLVRIHVIIGRFDGETPIREEAFLETEIEKIVRTWKDGLTDAIHETCQAADERPLLRKYSEAFPVGFQEAFPPSRALVDIERMERLGKDTPITIDFYDDDLTIPHRIRLALYNLEGPISLSRRVPILENLGFDVIDERSFRIAPEGVDGKGTVSFNDVVLETIDGEPIDLDVHGTRLENCFLAVWRGDADNDHYNRLVFKAGLDWREAAAIRAYGSYLRQIRVPFGQAYMSDTLVRHTDVAKALIELFRLRLDPKRPNEATSAEDAEEQIVGRIEAALEEIPSLDEDRILRHFLNLVRSTLRTNFYQIDDNGTLPPTIAFKFDSKRVEGAPSPRPYREISVYSPRVEGIHLRGGPIARGGLRWSDRAQDFRTEVLGLAKAQQVKNVVIIPSGSKGGFVPKKLPVGGAREEVQAEAVEAYKLFVSSLLSITDNLSGPDVINPEKVVRHDDNDPYLVVAADKGTATLSDTANEISTSRNFWLGDAFASGGSAGYDHKKMGITARGGWECVKRHFREMDRDIQTEPFTVIGVGDMSGDVFGNGMLLSKATKLLAAFDHRDIFIDPDPDPGPTWEERKRLFDIARCTWQDYNKDLISEGGGIFPRSAKSIKLTDEIRQMTGIEEQSVTPNQLIRALLQAEADLLWFGGIGTYVRGAGETDDDAGDRANDALRVTARELNFKAVGEGANLGMTQAARIEFAAAGGRVNTDAIDNSAGVNSSDLEVNIKIALGQAMEEGKLTLEERNVFLAEMTEQVAESCLLNNYLQSLAVSLIERRGLSDLGFQTRLMRDLERRDLLDRPVEGLPSDGEIAERQSQGEPLTRPELAVLLAYGKIDLYNALIESDVPDDPYFEQSLETYFPEKLREHYPEEIKTHRLRREIIATGLANAIINRGGSTMYVRLKDETGHAAEDIALAFTAATAVFDLGSLYDAIDKLDNRISGQLQLDLYLKIQDLLRLKTAWFLRHTNLGNGLSDAIKLYRDGMVTIADGFDECLPVSQIEALAETAAALEAKGIDKELAASLAALDVLADAPDISYVAEVTGRPVPEMAAVYSAAGDFFRLSSLRHAGEGLAVNDYFDRLAINSMSGALSAALRGITQDVVRNAEGKQALFDEWYSANKAAVDRARSAIDEILDGGDLTLSRLTVAVTHLRDLVPA